MRTLVTLSPHSLLHAENTPAVQGAALAKTAPGEVSERAVRAEWSWGGACPGNGRFQKEPQGLQDRELTGTSVIREVGMVQVRSLMTSNPGLSLVP